MAISLISYNSYTSLLLIFLISVINKHLDRIFMKLKLRSPFLYSILFWTFSFFFCAFFGYPLVSWFAHFCTLHYKNIAVFFFCIASFLIPAFSLRFRKFWHELEHQSSMEQHQDPQEPRIQESEGFDFRPPLHELLDSSSIKNISHGNLGQGDCGTRAKMLPPPQPITPLEATRLPPQLDTARYCQSSPDDLCQSLINIRNLAVPIEMGRESLDSIRIRNISEEGLGESSSICTSLTSTARRKYKKKKVVNYHPPKPRKKRTVNSTVDEDENPQAET